jgi:hypothetical protein
MATRRQNLQASQEFIDEITATRVGPSVRGGAATGRRLVRVRPEAGAPFETVVADSELHDPRRDTFGVEPGATKYYRAQAQRQAEAKRKVATRRKPIAQGDEIDLSKIGASTTFKSPSQAAQTFMQYNAALFDSPLFDDLDVHDLTRDFMDRIDVRVGKRFEKLYNTPRGVEILESGRSGSTIAKQMLVYLMGLAGPRRRWRDVPWAQVDEYVDMLGEAMATEAQRQHTVAPARGVAWYPLASGIYEGESLLRTAVDEVGVENAQRLADWMSSQTLYDLADRLDAITHPAKGPEGAAARRALRCIPGPDRKMIRHRASVVRQWAAHPEAVPAAACGAEYEIEGVSLCEFPTLFDDVRRIEAACQSPYDPGWPTETMALEGDGEIDGEGGEGDESDGDDLSLPWETVAANPLSSAAHARSDVQWNAVARRLARGKF